MAYNPRNLSVLAYANGFTLWHYTTTDDAATADTPPTSDARTRAVEEVELLAAEMSSIFDPDSGEGFNRGWEEGLTETARHCRAMITKGGE